MAHGAALISVSVALSQTPAEAACPQTRIYRKKKGKESWIYIAPHCENLASEVLRHGSQFFYAATTPNLPSHRKAFTRWRYHR